MTDGEPETASLQKIKWIKNPIIVFIFSFFYFIKSETSDSFVSHLDGHFAYLKTLDFYFKQQKQQHSRIVSLLYSMVSYRPTISEISLTPMPGRLEGDALLTSVQSEILYSVVSLVQSVLRTQELCESRGGRPGLPSLINLRFLWT